MNNGTWNASLTCSLQPEKVDTSDGPRGIQTGYNLCNATTEGQNSLCQTAIVNSLDDFCIWGPQQPNQTIADTEGALVAWCSKPGHGTRIIPPEALTGVQFMMTPDYLQVTGRINQTLINIVAGDSGGGECRPGFVQWPCTGVRKFSREPTSNSIHGNGTPIIHEVLHLDVYSVRLTRCLGVAIVFAYSAVLTPLCLYLLCIIISSV